MKVVCRTRVQAALTQNDRLETICPNHEDSPIPYDQNIPNIIFKVFYKNMIEKNQ